MKKEFWTDERVKAIGKMSQTLFSAFVIAGMLGGHFGQLDGVWPKVLFGLMTLGLFGVAVCFAENPFKKEK